MRFRESIRPWAIYALRLAIGVGILIACFTLLDVSALPAAFARIEPLWLFVAFVLTILGTIVLPAVVTRYALKIERIRLFLPQLIAINFTTRFYGLILPRAISYGVRWYQYKKAGSGADALALMAFEQTVQLFTMTTVAAIVLAFEHLHLGAEGFALFLVMTIGALVFTLAMTPFLFPATTRWLLAVAALGDRISPAFIGRRLHKLIDAVRAFQHLRNDTRVLIVLFSLLSIAVIVLTWYVVAQAIGIDVSPVAIIWIRGVLFLMLLSPITVAGLGVREAGIVGLLHLYGVPAYEALAMSLTLFGAQVAVGLIGANIELWRQFVKPHFTGSTQER